MSDNVGLSTPRGSGTSGYVQRNRAFIRPRDNAYGGPHGNNPRDLLASQQASRLRQPDQGILEHDRKRAIEVRVFALRDELEEEGKLDEDAIDERCDALRKKLTDEAERGGNGGRNDHSNNNNNNGGGPQRFKAHQVHEQARAKIVESERLRRALRINKDYQEGAHWRRKEEKEQQQQQQQQAQKRKVDDGIAAGGAAAHDKRRRYSDDSRDGYESYDDGEVGAGRSGRRASPPLKSVEDDGSDGQQRRRKDSGRGGRDQDRKPEGRRRDDYGDMSEGEVSDDSRSRGKGPARGRALRDSRSPRSASRSPSRSLSRSRSRSRGRSQSYSSRSPSRSRSRSPVRRRSRSDSRD
ncbi:hypothetical protein SPBR_00809 [Sporothrix brasiliensis 5110]|uniref:CWF21 domain-containing protein n=1 Tax=Sporothrix brasiliensis 5110 TaxID=1398154 RepID=A0A0C2IMR8_9PEZI|nr:uncharacterized protein SPBR_00809 [Sporothrix brasiliensis 5110]KIH90336.1 hypothetical protein SPBR_00809 [Sporothrix brasiliensis 5110]